MATKLRGVRARMPTEVELVETGSQDGDHHAEAAASDHADYEGDSAIDHADHEGEDSAIDHADLEGGGLCHHPSRRRAAAAAANLEEGSIDHEWGPRFENRHQPRRGTD